MAHSPETIRQKLVEEHAVTRRDGIVFAVTTVVLTPVALGLLALPILFLMADSSERVAEFRQRAPFIADGALVLLFVLFFVGSLNSNLPKGAGRSIAIAFGWLGAAVVFSFAQMLYDAMPVIFWITWAIPALLALASLGNAYEPRDDYYLGWGRGMVNDPFTLRDDVDRAHVTIGFIVTFASMIFRSFAGIFGSAWLWRGITDEEASDGAEILHALASHASAKAALLMKEAPAALLRMLVKLELVKPAKGGAELTSKGEKLTGVSSVL